MRARDDHQILSIFLSQTDGIYKMQSVDVSFELKLINYENQANTITRNVQSWIVFILIIIWLGWYYIS